ncbi:Protein kinase, putative [Hondaea fermentalgiana]|uniref:Protein kinase, putative n=1 Tax=Hondaea fermentalgiana TaxID=2315210 RepID=A0A2R5G0L3_9STRA|nr:Protein kinase, putative [Hondaea fermentalgiana]|eukprot:GBG24540.1 Protein kinase, putative [Hondaea fermentalgiana]
MDEIQDCIADAQFGEVLRGRETTRPNARITPPPADFDPAEFASSRGIDLAYCVAQPIGVYILSQAYPESKPVYAFLSTLHEFKRSENPAPDEYHTLLARAQQLPAKYRDMVVNLSEKLAHQVLPYLVSSPDVFASPESEPPSEVEPVSLDSSCSDDGDGQITIDGENHVSTEGDESATEASAELVKLDVDNMSDETSDKGVDEELARKRNSLSRQRTENKNFAVEALEDLFLQILEEESANWDAFTQNPGFERLMALLWYCEQPIVLDNFNIFRDLGRGAFGVVAGAKFRATGALLALKCMNKKLVKGKKAIKLVRAEREVLAKLGEHPSSFTVYLQYAFADKDNFYLALPLCSGGDLQYHLAVERYFEPERARFHIAEVVLGIEHLHSLGILYRDLKPDNILLDEDGHCRISDMGLAIVTNGKMLRGRAGTPGYWPPEMLQKKRYSFPVDWWSLGCVLYELLSGRCPFSKLNTKMERDEATLHWPLQFPHKLGSGMGGESRPFPEDAKAFISRLIVRDKNKRLGASPRGADDVKEDPYFDSIDWGKLGRKELSPPWVPKREQIHAFNQSDLDGKSNEHDYRKLKLTTADEIPDFDYTSSLKHQEDLVSVLKLEDEGKLAYLQRLEPGACCILS